MAGRTVQLRVGGQTYRVVSSAGEEELQRLAATVDARIAELMPPGRPVTPQVMLLAAMALAHDLEEERARSAAMAAKAKGAFGRLLERVDAALDAGESAVPQAPFAAESFHDGAASGPKSRALAEPDAMVMVPRVVPSPGPTLIAVGPLMSRPSSRSPDDR